jgi:four helix bundle protein
MPRDHKKLDVFHLADELVLDIYRTTGAFPKNETFGLVSQMRRSAFSVPANIVEGCARRTQNEYVQFLNIAMGSLSELGYFISLSHRLGYMDESLQKSLMEKHGRCIRALHGLIASFSRP